MIRLGIITMVIVCGIFLPSYTNQSVKTSTFAPSLYHEVREFNSIKKIGVALGFATLIGLLIFAITIMWLD